MEIIDEKGLYVTYEQAMRLKKLGYDQPEWGFYYKYCNDNEAPALEMWHPACMDDICCVGSRYGNVLCAAPLRCKALQWVRNVKNIACSVDVYQHYYHGVYYYDGEHYVMSTTLYLSYEQAESVLLDAVLTELEKGDTK
jgi:hypothetical protein